MKDGQAGATRPGQQLLAGPLARVGEILAVFGVGAVVIAVGAPRVGDNPLARGGVVWLADILMLVTVWLGLRLRGQGWEHFGLTLGPARPRTLLRTF